MTEHIENEFNPCDVCEYTHCSNCILHELAMKFVGQPAADVAPVVHAKWQIVPVINVSDGSGNPVKIAHCSNCGFTWSDVAVALKHFKGCPRCFARMDGE